jgi:(p)ppGpp synthase/HD superfamily hydrolase
MMYISPEDRAWIYKQHSDTNHFYDGYIPYRFHLEMVERVGNRFINLVPQVHQLDVATALLAHDLEEDTRNSHNDIKGALGESVANIVHAVTNDKGKSRKERAGENYYRGIRATPGAMFVKLCDRIANVQYSKMTNSSMFFKYKDENPYFMSQLGWNGDAAPYCTQLFQELIYLFEDDSRGI